MVIVVIGLLGLLVVHAAGKTTTAAVTAAGAAPTALPPSTSISPTGAAASPSPATWGGAPGAASSYAIRLGTNSRYPSVRATGLTTQGMPGQPGVPIALVPNKQFNGYDSVPGNTKQLSVNRLPARTLNTSNFGGNKL